MNRAAIKKAEQKAHKQPSAYYNGLDEIVIHTELGRLELTAEQASHLLIDLQAAVDVNIAMNKAFNRMFGPKDEML